MKNEKLRMKNFRLRVFFILNSVPFDNSGNVIHKFKCMINQLPA